MNGCPHNATALDESGQPVLTTEPDWESVFAQLDGVVEDKIPRVNRDLVREFLETFRQEVKRETAKVLLTELTSGNADLAKIGRGAVLLAHLHSPVQTQRELAARLGITPGRVSQELNAMRATIASLYAEKEHLRHSQN